MKRIILSLALAASMVPAVAFAGDVAATPSKSALKKVSMNELIAARKKKAVTTVDANTPAYREAQGVIPNAILLSSSSAYDVKELPADKATNLVFYCANEQCTSSDAAAQRAIEAGYTNVSVLPEGVVGWKKTGLPTERPNKT